MKGRLIEGKIDSRQYGQQRYQFIPADRAEVPILTSPSWETIQALVIPGKLPPRFENAVPTRTPDDCRGVGIFNADCDRWGDERQNAAGSETGRAQYPAYFLLLGRLEPLFISRDFGMPTNVGIALVKAPGASPSSFCRIGTFFAKPLRGSSRDWCFHDAKIHTIKLV